MDVEENASIHPEGEARRNNEKFVRSRFLLLDGQAFLKLEQVHYSHPRRFHQ
jgi:hypothetical protein